MQLPEHASYTDILNSSQVPKVTFASITSYLQAHEKNYDYKCQQLYEQRYVRFVRVSHSNNVYFIGSVVWAEMKKKTCYKVDISLDDHGVVCEAQCECGAGQGPSAHCKHVTTTLYALHRLTIDGSLVTELTCTQVLQTFHHSKPHTGSPMTTSDLHQLRKHNYVFDPRPVDKINWPGYQSHFRNTILGFQSDSRMPVTQLYKPANPHARTADHQYTSMSEEDLFLHRENILEINEAQQEMLERGTVGQHNNSVWKRQHTLRLTSSQFGVICRATVKKDLSRLASQLVSPRPFTSRSVQHGLQYEAVAVQQFEATHGPTSACGMFVCLNAPWLAASPDRIVSDLAILEVKCPYTAKDRPINPTTVPYIKEMHGTLQLDHNHPYYYQVQGQLLCSNRKVCYFCVYTLKDMKVFEIHRDDKFIAEMFSHLKQFFDEYFLQAVVRRYVYQYYDQYMWDGSQ